MNVDVNEALAQSQRRTLCALADAIIPPAPDFGVPGAGDALICDAIIADAASKLDRLIHTLDAIEAMAQDAHGRDFVDLDNVQKSIIAREFQMCHQAEAQFVEVLVSQCYYRDARVVNSLGLEARPPHPQGFEVEQGDWSLLDPVRQMPSIYRS